MVNNFSQKSESVKYLPHHLCQLPYSCKGNKKVCEGNKKVSYDYSHDFPGQVEQNVRGAKH